MDCIVADKQNLGTSLWGETSDCKVQTPVLKAWV